MIGNKSDLAYEFAVNQTDAKSQFYAALQDNLDREEIFEGIKFFETSAKLGTNVHDAFEHLARVSLDQTQSMGYNDQRGCCK